MTGEDFRRIALSLPESAEGSHFGNADFRLGHPKGRIFATLAYEKKGFGSLVLTPEQQAGMIADAPDMFEAVQGGWGRMGATFVKLANVTPDVLEGALRTAWQNALAKERRPAKKKKKT